MHITETVLTPLELAARWKLLSPDGTPSAARVVQLINAGRLPRAFRVNVGRASGPGPRDWRIPLADVLDYERRHAAPAPKGEAEEKPAAKGSRAAPRPRATGTDGKSRLGKGRGA